MNRADAHKKVIEFYGERNQLFKLFEELEEFRDEVLYYATNSGNIKNLIQEYADVLNTLEQFEIIFRKHFQTSDIIDMQNQKMQRTLDRIKKQG
jgi:hypothetical protein